MKNICQNLTKKIVEEVTKSRRKVDLTLKDIIDIIEYLYANDLKPVIDARNIDNVPRINPECVDLIAVTIKVKENEKSISDIINENVKFRKENSELKKRVDKIEKDLRDLLSRLNEPATEVDREHDSDLNSPAPASNQTDVDNSNPILATHGNNSMDELQIVGFPPIDQDNLEETPSKEQNDNVEDADLATALNGQCDINPGLSQVKPQEDATSVGIATTEVTENEPKTNSNNMQVTEFVSFGEPEKPMHSDGPKAQNSLLYQRYLASHNQAIKAALEAKAEGKSDVEIYDKGMGAAEATRKTYASMLSKKKNNSNKVGNQRETSAGTQSPIPRDNSNPNTNPVQHGSKNENSEVYNSQGKYKQNKSKNKSPHFLQYKRGKGEYTDINIAAERPKWLDHKCLVVSRVKKETTMSQFQEYINEIAKKNVKFLHTPRNLAKEYSEWRTIAIELSDEDYEILSNPNVWHPRFRIKDFVGRRFWRNKASIISPTERKSAVFQSWQS